MSLEGIIKFYIGSGLRAALFQIHVEQTLEAPQTVLTESLRSGEAAADIVDEIRQRSVLR